MESTANFSARGYHSDRVISCRLLGSTRYYPCGGVVPSFPRPWNPAGFKPAQRAAPGRICCLGKDVITVDPLEIQRAVDGLVASQVASKALALKEWAPICEALGTGDQMIVVRKGGIREKAFRPAASKFLLFPTGFHTDAELLRADARDKYDQDLGFDPKTLPKLELRYGAEVTFAFVTNDPAVLQLSSDYHILGNDFLEARLNWRPRTPLTIMELKCWKLENPVVLEPEEGFWGCFSWVDLSKQVQGRAWQEGTPVIPDQEFARRQLGLRKSFTSLRNLARIK